MDLCLLEFSGSSSAGDALDSALDASGEHAAWLDDVAIISRSAVGRMRIREPHRQLRDRSKRNAPGVPDEKHDPTADERLLEGSKVFCLREAIRSQQDDLAAIRATELERDVFQLIALEDLLEHDSSMLFLIAEPGACDAMQATFATERAKAHRQTLSDDVDTTLRLLLEQVDASPPKAPTAEADERACDSLARMRAKP